MAASRSARTRTTVLDRLFDRLGRLSDNLRLAEELSGADTAMARRLLERNGFIEGKEWRLPAWGAARLRNLTRLMRALYLDADAIRWDEAGTMQEMERDCFFCAQRQRCTRELQSDRVRVTYRDFCPNAAKLDDLRAAQPRPVSRPDELRASGVL